MKRKNNEIIYQYGGLTSMLRNQPDYAAEKTASYNPKSIFENLSAFGYGILKKNGKFIKDPDGIENADVSEIIIQTPEQYWERGAGMCHDASVFTDNELTDDEIEHMCFFCISKIPEMYITHSYVVFRENTGLWRISDPYSFQSGLSPHVYESEYEAGEKRFQDWITDEGINIPANASFLMSPHMPKGGTNLLDFINQIKKTFDKIK